MNALVPPRALITLGTLVVLDLAGCPRDMGGAGIDGGPVTTSAGDPSMAQPPGDGALAGDTLGLPGEGLAGGDSGTDVGGFVILPGTKMPTLAAASWIPKQAPAWARQESGLVVPLDGQQVLSASDCVKGMHNVALARASAENRARGRLTQLVQQYLDGTSAAAGATIVMRGVTVPEIWTGPRGMICARVVLPVTAK